MKTRNPKLIWLVLLCALCGSVAHADLAVTATPGFVFSDTPSGRPTVANLNRALNMTYTVSGSIGGTNAGLAAKSVSGTMLMDSVVDNVTLEYDGSSPRAIEIKDAGVSVDELSSAVAGLGLGGGSGAALSNKTDNVTITITNDTLTLATNIPISHMNVTSNSVVVGTTNNQALAMTFQQFYTNLVAQNLTTYTSPERSLFPGIGTVLLNAAHGLAATPTQVRGVIVCQTVDAGYSIGDEVDMIACGGVENGGSFERGDVFAFGANSTNVFCVQSVYYMYVVHKSTMVNTQLDHSKWKAKLYARP